MQFNELPITGSYHIKLDKKQDERGAFTRVFDKDIFAEQNLQSEFPQHSISENIHKHTLRGLHYQKEPYGEIKLVQCIKGKALDIIVDLRENSPTYLQHCKVTLSCDDPSLVYVPSGCAHAIFTLEDNTIIHYLISEPYRAESQIGLRWDDPALNIKLPYDIKVISERDANWPILKT